MCIVIVPYYTILSERACGGPLEGFIAMLFRIEGTLGGRARGEGEAT